MTLESIQKAVAVRLGHQPGVSGHAIANPGGGGADCEGNHRIATRSKPQTRFDLRRHLVTQVEEPAAGEGRRTGGRRTKRPPPDIQCREEPWSAGGSPLRGTMRGGKLAVSPQRQTFTGADRQNIEPSRRRVRTRRPAAFQQARIMLRKPLDQGQRIKACGRRANRWYRRSRTNSTTHTRWAWSAPYSARNRGRSRRRVGAG